jgi:flagellar hook-length control protein FliK
MQATPISNPSPANASSPATATLLPSNPRSPSPFTALFQAVLKGAGNSGKFPAAGKPQDSSREPAGTSATGNNLLSAFPLNLVAPAFAPILPEPSLSASVASVPAAPAIPERAAEQGPAALSNPLPLEAATDFAKNVSQASVNAQNPPVLPNPLSSTGTTGLAVNTVQPSPTAQEKAALSNPPISGAAGDSAQNTAQASATGQEATVLPNSLQTSAFPQAINAVSTIPPGNSGSEPAPISPDRVSQDPSPLQHTAPSVTPLQIAAPAQSIVPANAMNFLMAVATEQATPIPPTGDPNFTPYGSGLTPNNDVTANPFLWSLSQTQNNAAAPPSGPQNVPPNGSSLPNGKTAQAARADLSFLNMQGLIPAGAATKVSATVSPQLAAIQETRSNLQPIANIFPAPAETLAHLAAKSAAMGASTLKFHENLQPPTSSPALPAPVAATPAKTQTQDSSNGSSENESNPKSDHASNVSNVKTDERGFVQSLNIAAANPTSGQSAAADSTAGAAAAPVQAQSANSAAQPAAINSPDSRPTESLPASSQGAPVVNAAHIVGQPGQTEIRIEMQADSLGGIELRAHIAGDQIGASIAVEHHDAQLALATDLPALHSALVEKNLRVETLSVSQGNFSSLSGGSEHDTGQRSLAQHPAKFAYAEPPETPQAFTEVPAEWAAPSSSSSGLSVVA